MILPFIDSYHLPEVTETYLKLKEERKEAHEERKKRGKRGRIG